MFNKIPYLIYVKIQKSTMKGFYLYTACDFGDKKVSKYINTFIQDVLPRIQSTRSSLDEYSF